MQQKNIAIVGASNDRKKYGNKAVRAYLSKGYKVYPINPKEETIEGLKAYKSILDIPDKIELVSFYVPPAVGIKVVEEVAKKGNIKELYLNPGAESEELYNKAQSLDLNPIVACSISVIGFDPEKM